MLAVQSKLFVPFRIAGRQHAAVAGGDDLARMKRKTSNVAMRLADFLPATVQIDLAADRTGRIFHERQSVLIGNRSESFQIAGHAHLMNSQDRPSLRGDGFLNSARINIEGGRLNIDKNRPGVLAKRCRNNRLLEVSITKS